MAGSGLWGGCGNVVPSRSDTPVPKEYDDGGDGAGSLQRAR